MGGGDFILVLNATIRKAIGKTKGAQLKARIEVDNKPVVPPVELMECLADEPKALEHFNTLAKGHQRYFYNWINSAKTDVTKARRIALTVTSLAKKWDYGQMIRSMKKDNDLPTV